MWTVEDHIFANRKIAEHKRGRPFAPAERRPRGGCRGKISDAEWRRIDAAIVEQWPLGTMVKDIAILIKHSAPFVSRRARVLGLPERRPDWRQS